MTLGDRIAALCIVLYLVGTIAYWCNREWWKGTYYLAAAVLNISIIMMKS
jgi:hypothetical protein